PTGVNTSMRTFRDVNSYSRFVDGKLELQLTAENSYTFSTAAASAGFFKDLYLQADLQARPASAYWEAGLLGRGVRRLNNLQFYIYFVNSDAKWKVSLGEPGALKDLTDWQPLPMPGQAVATLGAMIKDNHLTLFYEGQPVGEVTDDTLTNAGT